MHSLELNNKITVAKKIYSTYNKLIKMSLNNKIHKFE